MIRTTSATGLILLSLLSGCVSYRTPGGGVSLTSLAGVDQDIAERYRREPRAQFPARLAVVRAQSSGYRSYRADGYGEGRYSIVTVRDVEQTADAERLAALPMIAGIAPLNRLVVPERLESDKELRLAAASVQADMLLVYTFDTRFRIDEADLGPLELITLGFLPNKMARVTTTASGALFDVRTGFIYGLLEDTAFTERLANTWTSQDAVDAARAETEAAAYRKLLDEFANLWKQVVEEHVQS